MSIELLRRQRGRMKAKLTTITTFTTRVEGDLSNTTLEEIETRLQGLDDAYNKFQVISQQLLALVPEEEAERDADEETEFDERYFTLKSLLLQYQRQLKPSLPSSDSENETRPVESLAAVLEQQTVLLERLSQRSQEMSNGVLSQLLEQQTRVLERVSVQSSASREPQVKLPIIKLPTFSGSIEDWKRYADTFKTLIHDSELSNVQKHQYLVGSLSGPAAKIIESIEISDQNYIIAWELLKGRYKDERAIRKRHIQCLFEMPRVHRESASAIQNLVDHVQKHLRVLHSMKLPTESWGELMIYLIERNLDSATRKSWEEHIEGQDSITTSIILEFLQRRCQVLERASLNGDTRDNVDKSRTDSKSDGKRQLPGSNSRNKTSLSTTIQGGRCNLCQGSHLIYSCSQFLRLSPEDRMREAKRLKLCINCLKINHFAKDCRSSACRQCGEKHNTLCHFTQATRSLAVESRGRSIATGEGTSGAGRSDSTTVLTQDAVTRIEGSSNSSSVYRLASELERKQILMSTAIVNVKGDNGYECQLRILLDSASEINCITLAACKKLGLKLNDVHQSIKGLNSMNCVIKHGCQVQLKSRVSEFELNLQCLVVSKIARELPSFTINISQLAIPKNLNLADPMFYSPSKVDALIGGEFFFKLLQTGKIELGENVPILQNSKFGWIIAGSIPDYLIVNRSTIRQHSNAYTCLFVNHESVNDELSKFWELEEYQINKNTRLSAEEQACENYFVNTTKRDISGRFVVRLPFRENKAQLGESHDVAMKRLHCLERKFQRNPEFYKQYSGFIQEYIDLNHMSRVTENFNGQPAVYLPHHGVIRESSTTTKLRVVFDGSAKTTSGVSLNDTLMVGANLQDNIIDIILRFRLHAIAITADLCKMYRQILVHEDDREFQRILWRFSPNEPIQECKLNTVTYGLACAPFLTIRCVRYLASSASDEFSQASKVLLNDLYVDDILTGVDCEAEAMSLISQLRKLLNSGGFEAHKWHSSNKKILREFESADRADGSMVAIDMGLVKTLGLNWHPELDTFQFIFQPVTSSTKTKREVLSAISKLFDPLGLVSPILIRAKLIMQETWAASLKWDDPLTHDLQRAWNAYVCDLEKIQAIRIPRRVIPHSGAVRFYLHAFCDASLEAYGACIYLLTIDSKNNRSSNLLCSKSRVAPIKNKTITLPKLELCGAVVLIRLLQNVKEALKIKFDEIHAWSDSMVALAWIAGDPSRQKMFVSNRTAEIQSTLPSNHWHHVRSEDNPADLISRGTSIKNLKGCRLWWEGPDWLTNRDSRSQDELQSVLTELSQSEINQIEAEKRPGSRINLNLETSNSLIQTLLSDRSSLSRVERVLAWALRFIQNAKLGKADRRVGCLSTDEIREVHQILIKTIQGAHFASEIAAIQTRGHVNATSKLSQLSPFVDKGGVLRVGGRIQNAVASFEKRHPILLPSDSKLTRLLFEREHRRLLHAGPQSLLYAVRERYWPLGGRSAARKVVHGCVICFRNKPKTLSQIMGQLPADRVTPARPFLVSGVDFAGPIITLVNRGRGRKTNKSYIALFVCFTTKAIHIELVSDLSSASFIAALRRFVGRRGCPQRIYSDNATNFVGASNEIREMRLLISERKREISDEFCIPNHIDWKFIPPSSPHMGGLWEAGVKSCKFHLKRIIGNALLTFEELNTILIQVEACLNSRPICQLPSTPEDLQPLTPGHFLIGEPLTSFADNDLSDVRINRLDRWQLLQKITQDFWKRWSAEYLTSLQGKVKWKNEKVNLTIDDIVLMQDNNSPPLRWKLGRVIEIHKGIDDKVRVVTLKTATGTYKRSINKLCKLPSSDSNDDKL